MTYYMKTEAESRTCLLKREETSLQPITGRVKGPVTRKDKIKAQRIIQGICEIYAHEHHELTGKSRRQPLAFHRQMAMLLIRQETNISLPGIGALFACDHSNILYACRKLNEICKVDERARREIDAAKIQIRNTYSQ